MTLHLHPYPTMHSGVVAVVFRDDKFLLIRRSRHVRSPGMFCFPGGGVEAGESEEEAVVREFAEELNVPVVPIRRLWQSMTVTNVALAWWLVILPQDMTLEPNPLEVQSIHWLTAAEALALPELLASNRDFYAALARGTFSVGDTNS